MEKINKCRISGESNLVDILSLGDQYLTGVFPSSKEEKVTKGPLDLVWGAVIIDLWAWRSHRRNKIMTASSYESLSHSKWDCKYHVVFVPKYRKKVLYGKIRSYLGPLFHELSSQRGCKILEGHMVQDHVHMLISRP